MGSGFRIGRLFGIQLSIDWSWVFIFVLLTWNLACVRRFPRESRNFSVMCILLASVTTNARIWPTAWPLTLLLRNGLRAQIRFPQAWLNLSAVATRFSLGGCEWPISKTREPLISREDIANGVWMGNQNGPTTQRSGFIGGKY